MPAREAAFADGSTEGVHEHHAPHGGTLVELGEEFAHIELVLDAGTGTLTAYALDGEAEGAVRLTQPHVTVWFAPPGRLPSEVALTGASSALTGETVADTSQFRATVPLLRGVAAFDGSIKNIVVRGRSFEDVTFRYPSGSHD
jgi:hypothetical protein